MPPCTSLKKTSSRLETEKLTTHRSLAAAPPARTDTRRPHAQIPNQPLGEIDPARIDATVDLVKDNYQLATPVTAADVYAPGFVPK